MNNEIIRKITSLTLMTIMVAGGMTFAMPGIMPAAHAANANLFVSAENSQYNNYFGGPMVIEVVVIDSTIRETDQLVGEPDVTINGKIARMVQGTDGNWYAYFADRFQAVTADGTSLAVGAGLDFGIICDRTDGGAGISLTDTVGFTVAGSGSCNTVTAGVTNNVVRESKTPSTPNFNDPTQDIGQIGIDADAWPIIQLYDLNPTGNVIVQYNKGGGAQTATLTFDTLDGTLDASLDRSIYPQNAAFHATLTDQALNIDPTDEDSWTFDTDADSAKIVYQFFDESGNNGGGCGAANIGQPCGDNTATLALTPDISGSLGAFLFEEGGVLLIDTDAQSTGTPVIDFQDNTDQGFNAFDFNADPLLFSQPVTLTENGPNTGVFTTYDELDTSNMFITGDALRGTSATLTWDDTGYTAVVGFDFANIQIVPIDDTWNSGEEISVVLKDADANKNSRFDEDLDLFDPNVSIIPSMVVGSPITLDDLTSLGIDTTGDGAVNTALYDNDDREGDGDDVVDLFSGRALVSFQTVDGIPALFSDRAVLGFHTTGVGTGAIAPIAITQNQTVILSVATTAEDLDAFIDIDPTDPANFNGYVVFNYDIRSLATVGINNFDLSIADSTTGDTFILVDNSTALQGTVLFDHSTHPDAAAFTDAALIEAAIGSAANTLQYEVLRNNAVVADDGTNDAVVAPIVMDWFSFGFTDDGAQANERVDNIILRFELEETGDNTGVFEGSIEYVMLNQLNIIDPATYSGLDTIVDDPTIIVSEDFTDEDSLRINYADLAEDGTILPVGDQEEAPSHSGIVSLDLDSYKVVDTVVVTLEDQDLNVDSELLEIYTIVSPIAFPGDAAVEQIGVAGLPTFGFGPLGAMLNITFNDELWALSSLDLDDTPGPDCAQPFDSFNDGLFSTGMTMVETGIASGVFVGDFAVPDFYCSRADGSTSQSVTGTDIEVNYVDFRDASGEIIEVGDSAGIRANTGSVSLDRTVYPVPFGVPADNVTNTSEAPTNRSVFTVHATGLTDANSSLDPGEFLANGDLTIHIRVNDPDFDISPEGSDVVGIDLAATPGVGPVKVSVIRGANSVTIGYAGGAAASAGFIDVGEGAFNAGNGPAVNQFGPISEIAPDAGIFEVDISLRYTDGPADTRCPVTTVYTDLVVGATAGATAATGEVQDRFWIADAAGRDYCILQGDILQVEYTDPQDASGDLNTVTDSATFDLRNGVLQSDKSVYIIGSDMILTLIEPDLDLENDAAETYDLDLIEWDSDAATTTMGNLSDDELAFDPEPTDFRETGDSTGIFQIVIEIPQALAGDNLERGEEIVLEYTDWGPSGSDYVGEEDEDVNVTIFTSNFGATVELDQKVYTWTDKVYVTIVAPDHNFDSDLIDEIGETSLDPIKVSTRGNNIDNYKLVETGTDTGIFTGEVILTGFLHDADGDQSTGNADGDDTNPRTSPDFTGPTDGLLATDEDDGLTVSFEFSEDETVVGSALIRWNIGEVQWLEASYPASGTGVIRIIDPDMNLNPEAVDNFDADVWSDSDAGGIDLTVTETNEATGIFEGTVFFTTTDESSGHRLRVSEGDTVTAEYEDNTLPDPYTTADELDITATTLIGTIVPPLERAPAANLRTVDAFGNSLDTVSVDQQVQISADLANGQDREQAFAYLVQIQDGNGVTVSLAWITGQLSAGQSFSPALSWIPTEAGTYTATAFVWESVDNPTALSPPVSTTINVN